MEPFFILIFGERRKKVLPPNLLTVWTVDFWSKSVIQKLQQQQKTFLSWNGGFTKLFFFFFFSLIVSFGVWTHIFYQEDKKSEFSKALNDFIDDKWSWQSSGTSR